MLAARTQLANDLAGAYMNKGNALASLQRLGEAVAEYEKAIAILERLVNEEGQTQLANDLAAAYLNQAIALEQQEDFEAALARYESALRARTLSLEELRMFWLMPSMLQTLRYRLMTLLDLRRWQVAALDVLRALELVRPYCEDPEIPAQMKEAAHQEFARLLARVSALSEAERELLDAELGDAAEVLRTLLSQTES